MKSTIISLTFLFILLISVLFLPFISHQVNENIFLPLQKIGNIGVFGDGHVGIIFPFLNNSYIFTDPLFLTPPQNLECIITGNQDISNKTYDILIIGDSFTNYRMGFSNGVSRIGNYSTIAMDVDFRKAGNYFKFIENLISSGFIESSKPKFIILESAGRTDLNFLNYELNPKDRIAYDLVTLNLWLRYGDNIKDIIEGINPHHMISLLQSEINKRENSDMSSKYSNIIDYNGEPTLIEESFSDNNTSNIFNNILVLPNSTLLTKVGIDPSILKPEANLCINISILITTKNGDESKEYEAQIISEEGFRLIALKLDKYSNEIVNVTLKTTSDSGNNTSYRAYWINPTIISNEEIQNFNNSNQFHFISFETLTQLSTSIVKINKNGLLSDIWDENQFNEVFKVRDTIGNTFKNIFDIPFSDRFHKARLKQRVHSSNVEYDTIYYISWADNVRESYNYEKLETANNNLNNLSDTLKKYNITLFFLKPPDTSFVYENLYVNPPKIKASRFYEDIREIEKKYVYIDSYSLIKQHVNNGELDLYPIGTTHWSPKTGNYIAEEIVKEIQKNLGDKLNAL